MPTKQRHDNVLSYEYCPSTRGKDAYQMQRSALHLSRAQTALAIQGDDFTRLQVGGDAAYPAQQGRTEFFCINHCKDPSESMAQGQATRSRKGMPCSRRRYCLNQSCFSLAPSSISTKSPTYDGVIHATTLKCKPALHSNQPHPVEANSDQPKQAKHTTKSDEA